MVLMTDVILNNDISLVSQVLSLIPACQVDGIQGGLETFLSEGNTYNEKQHHNAESYECAMLISS